MLEKKYYDGMQIHDVLCECLDDYDTILTILEKFASLPSADVPVTNVGDTISRQAARGLLVRALKHNYEPGYAVTLMDSLPAAEPQRWIPVTERLPYPWDEQYLVSLAWGGVGVMEYKSTGFHNYGSFRPVPIETVTAWMPLPEAYRGGAE